ncbi:MAG: cytochrome-c peroxidase [Ferruginibacter sp.]|nr:cytochrome-c peroxidase [Cytophagales bacterium]
MKPRHCLTLGLSLLLLLVVTRSKESSDPVVDAGPYEFQHPSNFGNRYTIPADNPTTKEGVHLGRLLFYEKKLSANNTMSCGSCHQQDRAFTDGLAFSPGVNGIPTTRSSMSLANLLWVRQFFWDGRAKSLEEQAVFPLTAPHEMGQSLEISAEKLRKTPSYPPLFKFVYGDEQITGDRIIKAISQFERTLISANSRYDQYLAGQYQPTESEKRGHDLFMTHPVPEQNLRGANCGDCHGGYKTFMEFYHNNGLETEPKDLGRETITQRQNDRGRFRVPTLRNVALTAPYMHDGRFKTLAEVLDHYNEHIQPHATLSPLIIEATNEVGGKTLLLTPQDKQDVIAFMHLLTDSTFVTDPRFSDPNPPAEAANKTEAKR